MFSSASPNIAESLSQIRSPINILVILFVLGILNIPVHHDKSIGFPDLGDKYSNYGVRSIKKCLLNELYSYIHYIMKIFKFNIIRYYHKKMKKCMN